MSTLIRHRAPAADTWRQLDGDFRHWLSPGEDGFVPDFPRDADLLVPLALWSARRDDLLARAGRTGVLLEAGDDPAALAPDLGRLALVAVRFAKFADGRGYSAAWLLRSRHGYRGELRAVGDIGRDQLAFLERCGFDAFALRDDVDTQGALGAFGEVRVAYQPALARAA
jgi:uncharacterized protein (DUF934 family)